MAKAPDWYAPPTDPQAPSSTPDDVSDQEAVPAGFGVRAGARLLDTLAAMLFGAIGGTVGGALTAVLAASGMMSPGWLKRIQTNSIGTFAMGALASLTYHALAEGLGGATVGKAILGLRVKHEGLGPCGIPRAIGRNLAYYIDALFFGLVGYTAMSKSRMQQRYGDQWSHTVVVRAASLPPGAAGGLGLGLGLGIAGQILISTASIVLRAL